MAQAQNTAADFLPNFGSLRVATRILLFAVTIAVIIVIGRNEGFDETAIGEMKLLAAFSIVLTLLAIGALKLATPAMRSLSAFGGTALAILIVLGVLYAGTEGMIFLLYQGGFIGQRWPVWHDSLVGRTMLIGVVVGALGLRYLIVSHRAEADARAEQEARMQALQSRIRPHFLFNSMNSIASLTRSDPARAEAALQDLADLFRVLLKDARNLVPIAAERELSRQYLDIEKMRLGDRLKVTWNVHNVPKAAMVPALTLQPLLENAIYHGIELRFSGGTLRIEIWSEGDFLYFLISNPLPENRTQGHAKGNKIAQENIRMRLQTHYGAQASMQSFEEGGHYHVKLKMPVVRG